MCHVRTAAKHMKIAVILKISSNILFHLHSPALLHSPGVARYSRNLPIFILTLIFNTFRTVNRNVCIMLFLYCMLIYIYIAYIFYFLYNMKENSKHF